MRRACEKLLTELNIDFRPDTYNAVNDFGLLPTAVQVVMILCYASLQRFCYSFQKLIVTNILFHPFLNFGAALQSFGDVLLTHSLNSWLHEQQSTLSELSTLQNFPDNAADILTIMIYFRSCERNKEEAKFRLSLSGLPSLVTKLT